MTIFLKAKKINLLLNKVYGFTKIKDDHFTIRCAITFYINIINTVVVWWQFFLLKKWTKVGANFFFDSEFLIWVLFQRPTTSKNGRFSW
jgi:hypothetical protein